MLLRWRGVDAPTLTKHWQEWYETHIGACWPSSARHKKRTKIGPAALSTRISATSVRKMRSGARLPHFWGLLVASRPSLGHLLGAPGRLLAALGRLLATFWALSGAFWLVLGAPWVNVASRGRPGPRFYVVFGAPGVDLGPLLGQVWAVLLRTMA